jgi:hypothetical protein
MKAYKLLVTQDQLDMIEGWALAHWMKYKDEDDRALIDDLLPRIKKAADHIDPDDLRLVLRLLDGEVVLARTKAGPQPHWLQAYDRLRATL